jgi:hypothetical protein
MRKLNLAFALAAGFLGGALTHYIAPTPAHFQAPTPVTKEVRAQAFTIVDDHDRVIGTFSAVPDPLRGGFQGSSGVPTPTAGRIVLRDSTGQEIWSAGTTRIHLLSER